MASPQSAQSIRGTSPIKTAYLTLYNAVSSAAWSMVLYRTLSIATTHGWQHVYPAIGEQVKWTQTMAALEIFHSLFGIVRAPVFTTIMQVSSRFLLVWLIVDPFPHLALASPAYTSMLVAWSVTEVIRYTYFVPLLALGWQPTPLTWLRYNTFFILYPLGITSECILVWLAANGPAADKGDVYKWALYGVLLTYVPGAYTLFTYMMKQRRSIMRKLKAQDLQVSK